MSVPGTGVATVTADYGPGLTATAVVTTGVKGFYVDIEREVLALHTQNSDPSSPQKEYDLHGVATFTVTISGVNYTITVS